MYGVISTSRKHQSNIYKMKPTSHYKPIDRNYYPTTRSAAFITVEDPDCSPFVVVACLTNFTVGSQLLIRNKLGSCFHAVDTAWSECYGGLCIEASSAICRGGIDVVNMPTRLVHQPSKVKVVARESFVGLCLLGTHVVFLGMEKIIIYGSRAEDAIVDAVRCWEMRVSHSRSSEIQP